MIADATTPTTEPRATDKQAFFDVAIVVSSLADQKYKDEVRKAIINSAENPQAVLDINNDVWNIVCSALLLDPPREFTEKLAQALQVTADQLTAAAKITATTDTPGEYEEQFIDGFEPQPKRDRYPAPPYNCPPFTMIPTAELFRKIHNLPFQNTDAGALAEIGIDHRPHEHHVYMLMLDKLAEQYPITPADKNILISLGNLYGERKAAGRTGMQGGAIITAEDIIKRTRGLEADDDVDPETEKAVTKRMGEMMNLRVSFDFTQHFEYRKKQIGTGEEVELAIPDDMRRIDSKTGTVIRFSYIGAMIHANTIEVEYESGRVATAWEILTPPIVFDYAQKIKQVATIETRLLDLRKRAKKCGYNSTGADVMKIYLIERINSMIDVKTHRPKNAYPQAIKLDTMFEDLRIEINNREQKRKKIDTARAILDHFKATPDKHRGQFIKDYRIVKGYRGAVTGFEIIF